MTTAVLRKLCHQIPWCQQAVLEPTVELALEIAREGREGLGSRHLAAASISDRLGAVAIVASESGVVRVFHAGRIEAALMPELWLLDRHHTQLGLNPGGVEAQRLGVAAGSANQIGRD
jgi:hypothetical protein